MRTAVGISCTTKKLPHVSFAPAVDRDRPTGKVEIESISDRVVLNIVWRP